MSRKIDSATGLRLQLEGRSPFSVSATPLMHGPTSCVKSDATSLVLLAAMRFATSSLTQRAAAHAWRPAAGREEKRLGGRHSAHCQNGHIWHSHA